MRQRRFHGPHCTTRDHRARHRHYHTVRVGRRVRVEDGAQHYLYAQQLTRLLHGAAGDDPLLAGPAGEPLAERAVANVLLTARLELGMNLTGPRMERRSPTGDRWTTSWGISIQELR